MGSHLRKILGKATRDRDQWFLDHGVGGGVVKEGQGETLEWMDMFTCFDMF